MGIYDSWLGVAGQQVIQYMKTQKWEIEIQWRWDYRLNASAWVYSQTNNNNNTKKKTETCSPEILIPTYIKCINSDPSAPHECTHPCLHWCPLTQQLSCPLGTFPCGCQSADGFQLAFWTAQLPLDFPLLLHSQSFCTPPDSNGWPGLPSQCLCSWCCQ